MSLDNLLRYESAAVANMNAKKEPGLAIAAMYNFYKGILGDEKDPIIYKALEEAQAGGETGISHSGVIQAIEIYGGKHEESFFSTELSELVKYLTQEFKIPEEAEKSFSKYYGKSLVELSKDDKLDKDEIQKTIGAISMLKDRKLREKTLGIVNQNVFQNLNAFYPKPDVEKK